MFPIKDDNPQVGTPIATYVLIGLNVLAWFLLQGFGAGDVLRESVCQYGLIPGDLFNRDTLIGNTGGVANTIGAATNERACQAVGGWSGVITSMFMHGSWMHIIGNMWFLWIFGDNVEDSMGSVRFSLFYILCGLTAGAAQTIANPSSTIPMVGASGAIGGVMGAYIVLYPRVKVHMLVILMIIFTTIRVPAIAMLGYWIVLQVLGGVTSMGASGGGTAFCAHVGGFAAGAALVWVFKDEELLLNHPNLGWKPRADPADIWNDPNNRE